MRLSTRFFTTRDLGCVTNSACRRLEWCYWIGRDLDFNGNKLFNEVAKFHRDETHSFARNRLRGIDFESAPREQMAHSARHGIGVPLQPPKSGGSKDFVMSARTGRESVSQRHFEAVQFIMENLVGKKCRSMKPPNFRGPRPGSRDRRRLDFCSRFGMLSLPPSPGLEAGCCHFALHCALLSTGTSSFKKWVDLRLSSVERMTGSRRLWIPLSFSRGCRKSAGCGASIPIPDSPQIRLWRRFMGRRPIILPIGPG